MEKVTTFFKNIWTTFKANAASMIAAMIAGSLLTLAATSTADAQNANCAPYDVIVDGLAENWNEYPAFVGTSEGDASATVVFAAPDGSTWSVVAVSGGVGCIVLAGEHSIVIELPAAGDPA